MSLWRHESSSCRKPRLSTEHCCRLHTLAIFCRPPGPASAAAPRTPSRVARGRARTRGLGVAPPAGGGAGARLRSPPRGPGAARSSSFPPGVAAHQLSVPRPGSPGTAPSYAGARSGAALALQQSHGGPGPTPGLLGFKLVPSITSYLPIARHQLLQVPHHCFSQLLGRNRLSRGRRGGAEIGINARMPLEALSPEVFKGEVDNSALSYRNTSPVFLSPSLKAKQKTRKGL